MASSTTSPTLSVIETEQRYWQATQDRDFEVMRELTADSFIFVQGDGISSFGREDFAAMLRDGDFRLKSFEIDEGSLKQTMLSEDVCFLAYRVRQTFQRNGSDGEGTSYNTSVLIKGPSGWQRAAHTISLG
jgi:hypothetical protein